MTERLYKLGLNISITLESMILYLTVELPYMVLHPLDQEVLKSLLSILTAAVTWVVIKLLEIVVKPKLVNWHKKYGSRSSKKIPDKD